MSYSGFDFTESLSRAQVECGFGFGDVARVIAAHGGSSEGWGEWSGGFVLALKDGRYAYLSGWCDTTGWGCQDGISCEFYEKLPDWRALADVSDGLDANGDPLGWDEDPADLNGMLAQGTNLSDDCV